ncbi:hypothetical protein BDA99DRAFT_567293 [Phascolomyces articulosus]|uniref:Lupus La protein n=1 Tax=Phascolomyces articulosus TaxID=60185 RepID=A0AAD5KRY1_9FUNG|nr:hypothetical protein BDA99DRAFT_567293 [Phascolomyces articulosus]
MSEQEVLQGLQTIYQPDNLKKNAFFRELLEQDPERWISLKKISVIKQMKPLVNGDLELLIRAIESSNDEFEVNEQKTKVRTVKALDLSEEKPQETKDGVPVPTAAQVERFGDHLSAVNKKSIYAKGFPENPEPSRKELTGLFAPFGRVMHIKYRRDDAKKFKGSVFIEFESEEVAQKVVTQNPSFKGKELLVMLKCEYIEMKAKEKYADQTFEHSDIVSSATAYLEYEGAGDMRVEAIKDLIKEKLGVTVVHVYRKKEKEKRGNGVVQLNGIYVEDFLAKLSDDNKLEELTFKAADDESRGECMDDKSKLIKALKSRRGGRSKHNHQPRKKQKTSE